MSTEDALSITHQPQEMPLAHGQRLLIACDAAAQTLRLLSAEGQVTLTIAITPNGPVLSFDKGLTIEAGGDLQLRGDRLNLHGRQGLSLSSGGDVSLHAEGRLKSEALSQQISATLGDVRLQANDDVRFNGERVLVNCPLPEAINPAHYVLPPT